ncbi:MAG: two-component system, OmpR family, sensor kinase [Pseudonocardiales bacterium]|nr:two-component system, OmpR family, sensor kinase [Pseudonocardiales bacterium]
MSAVPAGPPPTVRTRLVAPAGRPRRRASLAWRVTASCLLVALVAVGVAALVSLRLVTATARQVTHDVLAQQADVVAAQLDDPGGAVRSVLGLGKVVQVLEGQDVAVVPLGVRRTADVDKGVAAAITRSGAARALSGTPVSATVDVGGTVYLVEARPAGTGAFALVRTSESGPIGSALLRRNIGFSLLAGVGVAVLVGVVVGRLLARPLRRTASAAHLLRSGRRDVRVPVEGPVEVAEVAGAVNELADALARSEARQREFLLSVSHELRTPLTAVRGFAESLADGVVDGTDVAPTGAVILREAQRLDRLVSDLMELARLEADDFALDPMPVDLTALATEASDVWRARCQSAGVAFRLVTPPGPVLVTADPRRLRQVLDGLAENALRVTPSGAPLVFAVLPGALQIRDGGPGLAPEDYAVVFERGALHDRYHGHRPVGVGGIGLALVHGLVTRMGGTIRAEPAVEGGACFTVALAPA